MTHVDMIRTTTVYRSARANGLGVAAAVQNVRCHWNFMKRLSADVAAHKKRSRAAKKAWKTRRATS